ncbi:MAG: nucleotide exchange factor GrpE [Phycisphaerae bacterium]|nr:nucleotide exchange factor GrpE [Phycisphaerae bacterium]
MSKKKKNAEAAARQPADQAGNAAEAGDDAQAAKPAEVVQTPEQERDDLMERLQRLAADYQNYQKRAAREQEAACQFANESLMKELLSVVDDMERALAAARENHDESDPLLTGMQMVHDKMVAVLDRFGLEPIASDGQPFDPEKHSAMMQEETADVEPMTVLRELQKGYELKGRTLRPSAVVVSKAPAAEEANGE